MADRLELFGMIDDAQTVNLQYTINDVSTVGGIPAHSTPYILPHFQKLCVKITW